jgi:uncharacterized protein
MPASVVEGDVSSAPAERLALGALDRYRRLVSPLLPAACRFHPTCSAYCAEAIQRHGLVRGVAMGVWRLLRCQPLARGGFDPVR